MRFETIEHNVDLCVVGGGLSGLCAAVAAARHGIKVVLMQERPMLGGNASSEIRMWICGAGGGFKNMRETGIIEELLMENQYRNPDKNYSIWDTILYEIVAYQEGITLLLNCSCNECETDNGIITAVKGWQMTTQKYHRVKAKIFADCSGDSVLAPLSSAKFFWGREAKSEYNEAGGQEVADKCTMGLSCLLQARYDPKPSEFIPPKWAYHYTKEDLPYRLPDLTSVGENFWFLEIGGDKNSIDDTEELRDDLLRIGYGIWDYCKNAPENKEKNANWKLDWIGFLPGKRESRRYHGKYVMTQNDLAVGKIFDDVVAYGGWSMDDHNPGGFNSKYPPNRHHHAECPYGIPLRALYSVNVSNLMFAGRNISATHIAMSSTRVMATCALVGQAVGTAAAIAVKENILPEAFGNKQITKLQNYLMDDDCWLPSLKRKIPDITINARMESGNPDAENLRNGTDRPINGNDNGCYLKIGETVTYSFETTTEINKVRLVFDSDLNRETLPSEYNRPMLANRPKDYPQSYVPKTMTKAYRIEAVCNGDSMVIYETNNNYQRLNTISVNVRADKIRFVPLETWGAEKFHIFAFDVK